MAAAVRAAHAHDLVSHGNTLLAPLVGLILCVPQYIHGTMLLGEVTQAAAAFVAVQGAFNWLVDNYPAPGRMAVVGQPGGHAPPCVRQAGGHLRHDPKGAPDVSLFVRPDTPTPRKMLGLVRPARPRPS